MSLLGKVLGEQGRENVYMVAGNVIGEFSWDIEVWGMGRCISLLSWIN